MQLVTCSCAAKSSAILPCLQSALRLRFVTTLSLDRRNSSTIRGCERYFNATQDFKNQGGVAAARYIRARSRIQPSRLSAPTYHSLGDEILHCRQGRIFEEAQHPDLRAILYECAAPIASAIAITLDLRNKTFEPPTMRPTQGGMRHTSERWLQYQ